MLRKMKQVLLPPFHDDNWNIYPLSPSKDPLTAHDSPAFIALDVHLHDHIDHTFFNIRHCDLFDYVTQ